MLTTMIALAYKLQPDRPALKCRRMLPMLAFLTILSIAVSPTWAQSKGSKPGGTTPPAPPPPGTIYFTLNGVPASMDGAGGNILTNLSTQIPANGGALSSQYYDGRRWSIYMKEVPGKVYQCISPDSTTFTLPHLDIFAGRIGISGQLEEIQLTDLFGKITGHQTIESKVVWSNDGLDSFFSYKMFDVSAAATPSFFNGLPSYDVDFRRPVQNGIVRVDVSASQFMVNGLPLSPVTPDSLGLGVVVSVDNSVSNNSYESNYKHTWSPDGTRIAYVFQNNSGSADELRVLDLFSNSTQTIWYNPNGSFSINNPQWQAGQGKTRIAFNCPVLYTIDALNGLAPIQLRPRGNELAYWSPNGEHLCFSESVYTRKGGDEYYIKRVELATGTVVNLSGTLDKSMRMLTTAWLPN